MQRIIMLVGVFNVYNKIRYRCKFGFGELPSDLNTMSMNKYVKQSE